MTRLSKREYFLISFLAVILIWFLGWNQLVRPQMDRLRETRERLALLEVEREQVELHLGRKPESVPGKGGSDYFYTDLDDVAVDRLLQQMAADSGVAILRMEIGDPAVAERKLPGSDKLVYTGMETVPLRYIQVGMELEAGTFEQIAAMAEQIYAVERSVVTDRLEAQAVYGRDSAENPEFQGIRCTMGFSFYYVDGPGLKENGG